MRNGFGKVVTTSIRVNDLEAIRDWNLRAGFGAWNAIKNKGAYDRYDETGNAHKNAKLTWMAYIGGPRETQQLLGDVILTEEDVVSKKPYPDGCVLTTWSVDLHYPKEQYAKKYPGQSVSFHTPCMAKVLIGKRDTRFPIAVFTRATSTTFSWQDATSALPTKPWVPCV